VIAAFITLCGTIITAYIGYLGINAQVEKPMQATQTAEILRYSMVTTQTAEVLRHATEVNIMATQTAETIYQTDEVNNIMATQTAEVVNLATEVASGTPLPRGDAPGFSLAVEPGSYWLWAGLVQIPLDRDQNTQTLDPKNVSNPEDLYSRFSKVSVVPNTVSIILTGHSAEDLTYIPNRVPIRILSYQSVPETVDLLSIPVGGGDDVWLFSVDISSESTEVQNQICWASYSSDLKTRLSEQWQQMQTLKELGIEYDPLAESPTEIIKLASGESPTLPDYFEIKENELMVFSVAALFKEPGIYTIEVGVEYVYNGYKNIVWANSPFSIFVPNNYYMWNYYDQPLNKIYLDEICQYTSNGGHICEEVCQFSADGLICK